MVYGTAAPAGSKKAFVIPDGKDGRGRRASVSESNPKSRPWQTQVSQVAGDWMGQFDRGILEGPLKAQFTFYTARPQGHFRRSGELSATGTRNPYPAKRPDVLKLARGVEDALTGIVYRDDAQITEEHLLKLWGTPERVEIRVERM